METRSGGHAYRMIPPFGIAAPQRILFGRGRAVEAAALIRDIGTRALVVHGADASRSDWLVEGLREIGVRVSRLATKGEPTLDQLRTALIAGRQFAPEVVVSLGGGAAIDMGKAIAALIPAGDDPLDHLEVVGRGRPLPRPPVPFAAIPTTSGTGAEATKNAVLGVPEQGRKVSLRDDGMLARLALIDPALTDGSPRHVTLASGLDAIAQLIEPYICTRSNPFSDALCQAAIPAGLSALVRLMNAEDKEARDTMAWVSLASGLALASSGLGTVHGLAGVIGGMTGAPHGKLCGVLLPHVLHMHDAAHSPHDRTGGRLTEIKGWIAEAFGAPEAISAFEHWIHDNGLPRLSQLGVRSEDHSVIACAALESSSIKADPTQPGAGTLTRLLNSAG